MPCVSVIVPCYNEELTIPLLLEAIYAQTFRRTEMEVIIADGMSTDSTLDQISAFQSKHPDLVVHVVLNKRHTIPAGLNTAIETANGDYIVRLDAHSMPRPDYIANCVSDLQCGLGEAVGGVWEIVPGGPSWIAKAIAASASHPLGVGDARYRLAAHPGSVDTVPFGAFRRSIIDKIGPFNEELLTNEDYEFNTRVRQAGGIVWLDPAIRSIYFARPTLLALARQYWRYGYWKARMLRRYPRTLRWRQALPPLFILSLIILGLLAFFIPLARSLLVIFITLYILVLILAGVQLALRNRNFSWIIGVPLSMATMHLTWGSAFLWSLIR